jgi:glutathione synthase
MPNQYTEESWKTREELECSRAFKCPDLFLQLVNFKYIQYLLNKQEIWDHFGFSEDTYNHNKSSFCDMKIFKEFEGDKAKLTAFLEQNGGYSSWVMKPQREGGANNFYNEKIKEEIEKTDEIELHNFVFMERINPT